ncbi:hypothetical protein WJX75_007184 [Coccomyxa subellipsoidea]|uniref:SET domain-containing protein n=1 Tax=Coccomyxa subellipsoidea TaxID=248742 RepID=A0ABR2YBF1_9CHLO
MPDSHPSPARCHDIGSLRNLAFKTFRNPSVCLRLSFAANTSPRACAANDDRLLIWLVEERRALPGELKIGVNDLGGSGRGLVAQEDVAPGEILLSVPLDSVFSDLETDESSHLSWSGRMALKLLEQRAQCDSGTADGSCLCPWIASLPQHVHLPFLYFSQEDLTACQDEGLIREAGAIRDSAEATFQSEQDRLAEIGCGWEDMQWAMSVLHSRCFLVGSPPVRTSVPGVDMANHSFEPSAAVRLVHSPEAVQGRDAVEEVCAPPPAEPSRFELFAGEGGIRAGDEVTISYGPWPNDVYYLFFGFVPRDNPFDVSVLFGDLQQMVAFHDATKPELIWSESVEDRAESLAASLSLQHGITDCTRLGIAPQGYDERLLLAAQTLLSSQQHLGSESSQSESGRAGHFLALRCQEILGAFPKSLAEDIELRNSGNVSPDMLMSLRYRLRKKATLLAAINVDKM